MTLWLFIQRLSLFIAVAICLSAFIPKRKNTTAVTVEMPAKPITRTIVVLGAAYAGRRAVQVLAHLLPENWKLVVIERNTHFNHVYVFPRYTVISSHAPKAFVPYIHAFEPRPGETIDPLPTYLATPPLTPEGSDEELGSHSLEEKNSKRLQWVHGEVVSMASHSVTFKRLSDDPAIPSSIGTKTTGSESETVLDGDVETVNFDFCLYALGASLPSPVDVWTPRPEDQPEGVPTGLKTQGVNFMEKRAEAVKKAKSVIVVGGGALGIQLATDIKDVHPETEVTLIHSRGKLMPIYPQEMHDGIVKNLEKMNIRVILGERVLTWPQHPEVLDGKMKEITTSSGHHLSAELVLPCTGQKPLTSIISAFEPSLINPKSGRISVSKTLQVSPIKISTPSDISDDMASVKIDLEKGTESSDVEGGLPLDHIFAAGDCAETGSIQAGHTAYWQGQCAAYNILRLVNEREGGIKVPLEKYEHGGPAIKVSLGVGNGIISNAQGVHETGGTAEDLGALVIWKSHGCEGMPLDA